ncbi:MAG: hypothetical protein ACI9YB_003051 [Halioglobus sp.]|jgi:hypothetical protein
MASPLSPAHSINSNSGQGYELTDSFPLNQLGLPDYMARHPELYPDYNPEEDMFADGYESPVRRNLLPSPFEGDAIPSQELEVSSQAFKEFFEDRRDPICTLEFCTKLVVLIHEGNHIGPAHMISREAYEELKRRGEDRCPKCRVSIIAAEDISEKIKAYLKNWTEKRFSISGDNALHKALGLTDSSVFFALLATDGAEALLFETNKAGVSPLQSLLNKADYKTAFDETLPLLFTPEQSLLYFNPEKKGFFLGSKLLKNENIISLEGKDYTIKALKHTSERNVIYLLDGESRLFRMEAHIKPVTSFTLRLNGENGYSSFFQSNFKEGLILGRGQFPHSNVNLFVSRSQWALTQGSDGSLELSERAEVLNKARLIRQGHGGETLRYSFEKPIPLQRGDRVTLNEKLVFSVDNLVVEREGNRPSAGSKRKRSRAEMER